MIVILINIENLACARFCASLTGIHLSASLFNYSLRIGSISTPVLRLRKLRGGSTWGFTVASVVRRVGNMPLLLICPLFLKLASLMRVRDRDSGRIILSRVSLHDTLQPSQPTRILGMHTRRAHIGWGTDLWSFMWIWYHWVMCFRCASWPVLFIFLLLWYRRKRTEFEFLS